MKFTVSRKAVDVIDEHCLIVFIKQHKKSIVLSSFGEAVDAACDRTLSGLIKRKQLDASLEHIDVLFEPYGMKCKQLMMVGLGEVDKLDKAKMRKLLGHVMSALSRR